MNHVLRVSALAILAATALTLGCEATKNKPPKQADEAPLQSQKYGDQKVVLEPGAGGGAAPDGGTEK